MTNRHTADSITSDALDQLYDDLDRYEEVLGGLNETLVERAKQLGSAEAEVKRLRLMVDEYGAGASALTDKIKRVRDLANLWLKRTDQLKRGGELLTAALDHPASVPAATEATEPCTGRVCAGTGCSHERAATALIAHDQAAGHYPTEEQR